jgi:hypothetical protein
MEMKTILVMLGALALAGCGATAATEVRVETVKVPVPAPCPARPAYEKLKKGRPVPLRNQPMPGTAEERVARQAAQLGRFEAEGGWADQVEAALDRCQLEGLAPGS